MATLSEQIITLNAKIALLKEQVNISQAESAQMKRGYEADLAGATQEIERLKLDKQFLVELLKVHEATKASLMETRGEVERLQTEAEGLKKANADIWANVLEERESLSNEQEARYEIRFGIEALVRMLGRTQD